MQIVSERAAYRVSFLYVFESPNPALHVGFVFFVLSNLSLHTHRCLLKQSLTGSLHLRYPFLKTEYMLYHSNKSNSPRWIALNKMELKKLFCMEIINVILGYVRVHF